MGMLGVKGETEGGGGGGGSLVAWELGIEQQRRWSWWRFTTDAERFGTRGLRVIVAKREREGERIPW